MAIAGTCLQSKGVGCRGMSRVSASRSPSSLVISSISFYLSARRLCSPTADSSITSQLYYIFFAQPIHLRPMHIYKQINPDQAQNSGLLWNESLNFFTLLLQLYHTALSSFYLPTIWSWWIAVAPSAASSSWTSDALLPPTFATAPMTSFWLSVALEEAQPTPALLLSMKTSQGNVMKGPCEYQTYRLPLRVLEVVLCLRWLIDCGSLDALPLLVDLEQMVDYYEE